MCISPSNFTWIRNRRGRKPQTGRFQHLHTSMEWRSFQDPTTVITLVTNLHIWESSWPQIWNRRGRKPQTGRFLHLHTSMEWRSFQDPTTVITLVPNLHIWRSSWPRIRNRRGRKPQFRSQQELKIHPLEYKGTKVLAFGAMFTVIFNLIIKVEFAYWVQNTFCYGQASNRDQALSAILFVDFIIRWQKVGPTRRHHSVF